MKTKLIVIAGLILGLIFGSFFFDDWISAYLSPKKVVEITVNRYGEARWELIIFPAFLVIMLAALGVSIKGLWSKAYKIKE